MTRCFKLGWILGAVLAAGCDSSLLESELGGAKGKADTGWLGDTSFEVGGTLEATVVHEATGEWAKLATDRALQEKLVDLQLKFGKNGAAEKGWRLNQLADKVEILGAVTDGERVAVRYRAEVDLIRKRSGGLPALEELSERELTLLLPEDPIGVYAKVEDRCAEGHDSGLGEYNYYYYFAPNKQKPDSEEKLCDLGMREAALKITKVYQTATVYPEYDKLRGLIDEEQGIVGFRVAIVPMGSEFAGGNRRTLEEKLKLNGERSKDGESTRYVLRKEKVEVTIDLFEGGYYSSNFRKAIGDYQVVLYDGHSSYGTLDLLTDPKAYHDGYQIVVMDSCRSYEYYARQVFRAKASASDPTGFAGADVIGTGMPAPVSDSGKIIEPVLTGLTDGLAAIERGEPEQATSWQAIISRLNSITWDSVYGAAGARANAWQPPSP
jgi:hypothetical protein